MLNVYDLSQTTQGIQVETLLEAHVGVGGSPVILKPNRVEIYHCAHPDMLQAGYTWTGRRFISDGD